MCTFSTWRFPLKLEHICAITHINNHMEMYDFVSQWHKSCVHFYENIIGILLLLIVVSYSIDEETRLLWFEPKNMAKMGLLLQQKYILYYESSYYNDNYQMTTCANYIDTIYVNLERFKHLCLDVLLRNMHRFWKLECMY